MSEGVPALRAAYRLEDPFNYLQSLVSWFTSQPPTSPISCLLSCRLNLLYLSAIALGSLGVFHQEQGATDWEALDKQRREVSLAERLNIFFSLCFFSPEYSVALVYLQTTQTFESACALTQSGKALNYSLLVSRVSALTLYKIINKGSSVAGGETEASG